MELGGSLPHSQESTTCHYHSQIIVLTGAGCFLPGRAKDLSARRHRDNLTLIFYDVASIRRIKTHKKVYLHILSYIAPGKA